MYVYQGQPVVLTNLRNWFTWCAPFLVYVVLTFGTACAYVFTMFECVVLFHVEGQRRQQNFKWEVTDVGKNVAYQVNVFQ